VSQAEDVPTPPSDDLVPFEIPFASLPLETQLRHCFDVACRVVGSLGRMKLAVSEGNLASLHRSLQEYRQESAPLKGETLERLLIRHSDAIQQNRPSPFHWEPCPRSPWLCWSPALYAVYSFCGEFLDSILWIHERTGADLTALLPELRETLSTFSQSFLTNELIFEQDHYLRALAGHPDRTARGRGRAERAGGDPNPRETSRAETTGTARVESLRDVAAREYRASKGTFWLAAFPAELKVDRCDECDPSCGSVADGRVLLPCGGIRSLASASLGKRGAFSLLAFTLPRHRIEEMNPFLSFAADAGVALVAQPPAWSRSLRPDNPADTWIATLLLFCPAADGYVIEKPGGCRLITQPWAASLAALRDWHIDETKNGSGEREEGGKGAISSSPPVVEEFLFAPSGNGYLIKGFGETGHLPGYKGLDVIAQLIRSPGKPVSMLDLVRADDRTKVDKRSPQEVLDPEAKKAIRDRLRELEADLERARKDNATVEADLAETEIDKLAEQLLQAEGLGGKDRDLNNVFEKLRPKIHGRLNTVYKAMREAKPPMLKLAEHFGFSISAEGGTGFIYRPAGEPPPWQFLSAGSQ
jgi:hypothetical protein